MGRFDHRSFLSKLKSSGLYFGANAIGFLISFGTYPLFAKCLDLTEFAAFNYFNNYSGFFAFFFSFNLYMFFSAKFFKVEKNEDAEDLLKSLMSLLLLWNIIAFIIAYVFSAWILGSLLKVKFDVSQYLFFSLASVSAATLKSIFLIKLRFRREAFRFFLLSCLSKILGTFLGLSLVIYFEASARSRFIGVFMAELITAFLIYFVVFRNGGFKIPLGELRKILRFIWPLLLSSIVYYPLIGMDQMVLERFVSKEQLGLYSIGLNFATYLHTFNYSIYQTIEPDIIKCRATNNGLALKKYVFTLIGFAVLTTSVYCLFSKELISLLSHNKFTEAHTITNVLSLSYIFVLLFSIGNTLLTVENKGSSVLLTNVVGLFSITVLTAMFSKFGSIGVAWARVLAFSVLAFFSCIQLFESKKKSILFIKNLKYYIIHFKGIK